MKEGVSGAAVGEALKLRRKERLAAWKASLSA
jgi:hypothetical protein